MTSSWFFLSTLNYDARSTTHQILNYTMYNHSDSIKSTYPWITLGPTSVSERVTHSRHTLSQSNSTSLTTIYSAHEILNTLNRSSNSAICSQILRQNTKVHQVCRSLCTIPSAVTDGHDSVSDVKYHLGSAVLGIAFS